jgi:hypothetical protein
MAHIRHVMSAWTPAADGKGLAVGSREQTNTALTHANLSVNSTALSDIQAHAHHVINVVEGSSGDNYDASFGDPGDGFGVLLYAADANKHSGFAAGVDGASANVALHSVHVQDTSTNVVNWATLARDKALEAVATDDVAIAEAAMIDAQGLLDSALNGLAGSNAPVIDGGGARTAYQHGQLMAGYSPVFNTTAPTGLVVAPPSAPSSRYRRPGNKHVCASRPDWSGSAIVRGWTDSHPFENPQVIPQLVSWWRYASPTVARRISFATIPR